jgi:hypothetical protein
MRPPGNERPLRRWMAVALVMLAIGAGGLLAIRLRQPVQAVFTPVADAYISTAHPDSNYGAEPTLRADATPKIRSYLRFRLDGLSGRVVKAKLRLWSPTGDLAGYSVHPVSSGWVERDITSRSHLAAGTPAARSGPFGPGSWSSVDVGPLLDDSQEISLVVRTRGGHNITFDSREGHNRPQLVVWTKPARSLPWSTWTRLSISRAATRTEGGVQVESFAAGDTVA